MRHTGHFALILIPDFSDMVLRGLSYMSSIPRNGAQHLRRARIYSGAVVISVFAAIAAWSGCTPAEAGPGAEQDFDRLDGTGKSRKKVHVIEWEGNLEIHVYPKGSLAGLALKIDRKDRNKPVMVIGYRFDNAPDRTLTRRAVLSIPLRDGFRAFVDDEVEGYDKVIITNNDLSHALAAYELDPEPKHLYPEEHPARQVASEKKKGKPEPSPQPQPAAEAELDDHGRIRPFSW